ncbi:hypothetical protein NMY22_g13289 [Coprinellus aureogranulatus]|nr:hypothetical protein NMY22_g13289 [Coprinellus aureogranulatus]
MYALPKPSTFHSIRLLRRPPRHGSWAARFTTGNPPLGPSPFPGRESLNSRGELGRDTPESNASASEKLDTLPSTFTRRPEGESPYRQSSARPGKAAADRGQDLSRRWVQLERTLRAKKGLVQEKEEIEEEAVENLEEVNTRGLAATGKDTGRESVETFKGLVIPKKPDPPADDGAYHIFPSLRAWLKEVPIILSECCMSGCAICVYDLYEDSLQSYDDSVDAIQSKLRSMEVSESEWPDSIRPGQSEDPGTTTIGGSSGKSPALSAFEELERKLAAKAQ